VTYTGKVTVGGPPDLRDLPGLSVAKLAVGPKRPAYRPAAASSMSAQAAKALAPVDGPCSG
jgi:hypothetical protein